MITLIRTIAASLALTTTCALATVATPVLAEFDEASHGLMCGPCVETIDDALQLVLSDMDFERDIAIAFLRGKGQEGLDAVLKAYAAIKNTTSKTSVPTPKAEAEAAKHAEHLRAAADAVAQQFDAPTAGLFWHTDFETAKAEARKAGKPVLALRMLGKLTDEYSCANSRYFRTVLYANKTVSKFLRENFVLYWSSERPVPKISIDFGDGRSLTCTITGNSAHYVLDAQGRPVDCIPGLYGPVAFERALGAPMNLVKAVAGKEKAERDRLVKLFHTARVAELETAFARDRAAALGDGKSVPADTLKETETVKLEAEDAVFLSGIRYVDAKTAARVAMCKFAVEAPVLRAFTRYDRAALEAGTDDKLWEKIAALHAKDAALDEGSLALMRSENPLPAVEASAAAVSKSRVEDPFLRLVRRFESSIALDTVRNEYLLHAKIHDWFIKGEVGEDYLKLNERVYAELFLTPAADPWLGLVAPDEYKALRDAGLKGMK